MKKLFLILTVSIMTVTIATAQEKEQEKEKVVTGTINIMTPMSVKILDGYISNQLYSGAGAFTGFNAKLGAIYKKHDNLSWDLQFTSFKRAKWLEDLDKGSGNLSYLQNPAKTQNLRYIAYNVGYGTYCHWNFGKKLMIKAGGLFDVYGAQKTSSPDGTNNNLNFDVQMMLKAHAAAKYGWDFKKWSLDIHGRMSLPLVGMMFVSHPSETLLAVIAGNDHSVVKREFRHTFLASYHNYMSFDFELGIDFVLKPFTFTLGYMSTNKWWNVYNLQYINKINCMTLGVSFDIVSRSKFKTSNINF